MLMWVASSFSSRRNGTNSAFDFLHAFRYPSTFNFEKKEDRSPFLPDKHIFYAQRAIDVEDGTAKWEGMPDDSKQLYEEHEHGQKGVAGSGSKKD